MTTLTVAQGSAPTLRLKLRTKDDAGQYVARDLTPVSGARLIIKANPDAVDPAPADSYPASITLVEPRTSGVVLVTLTSGHTTSAGYAFWKLDLLIGSTWTTAGHGRLHISSG